MLQDTPMRGAHDPFTMPHVHEYTGLRYQIFYTVGPQPPTRAGRRRSSDRTGAGARAGWFSERSRGTAGAELSSVGFRRRVNRSRFAAASRDGLAELCGSNSRAGQPQFSDRIDRSVPAMFSKAYRWIARDGTDCVRGFGRVHVRRKPRVNESSACSHEGYRQQPKSQAQDTHWIRTFENM